MEIYMCALSIDSIPETVLQDIFLMLPKDHAAIACVCKLWNQLQKKNVDFFARTYQLNREIQPYLSSRVLPTTDPQCTEIVKNTIQRIREFHGRDHFPPYPVDAGSLGQAIRQTVDTNLIVFFNELRHSIPIPALPPDSTVAEKAAFIREWMKDNQELLNQVRDLHLDYCDLNELPREIDLLVHLQFLTLDVKQLPALPSIIPNFVDLHSIYIFGDQYSVEARYIIDNFELFYPRREGRRRCLVGVSPNYYPKTRFELNVGKPVICKIQ